MPISIELMPVSIEQIRNDFPSLYQSINGKRPIYFDNACVTLRPQQVIEAMNRYYTAHPSCHKRAIHKFGKLTTDAYLKAKEMVRQFIHAKDAQEIVFTKNATDSINIVAHSFPFKNGDCILTTDMEHNSNNLPWQILTRRIGVQYKTFTLSPDFTFDMQKFKTALSSGVRLVSVFHTSHVTGYTLPIEEIINCSHEHGALVLLDAAQSIAHQSLDVQKLDVDFLVFSFHKMLGPSGMGCLYAKKHLLEEMTPFLIGGETVDDVDYRSFILSKIPDRFEAGLQNYSGALGVTAAIQYLKNIGMQNILQHSTELNEFISSEIKGLPRIKLLGPQDAKLRAGIINLTIDGMDSGELSIILDETYNIMTRSGVHCCHAWYKKYKLPPSLRVSLYLYNTKDEAKLLVETLNKITRYF